jgi:hypothetical protein
MSLERELIALILNCGKKQIDGLEEVVIPLELYRAAQVVSREVESADESKGSERESEEERCTGCGTSGCDRIFPGGFPCCTHDDD